MLRSHCFFVLHIASCFSQPSVDTVQTLLNFQNFEEFVARSRPAKELPAAGKLRIATDEGTFIADRIEEAANGSSWLRARGVQYAEHPIGHLRWQPPVPKHRNAEIVMDATQWGDDCTQAPYLNKLEGIQNFQMSESCLYLNIWAPLKAKSKADRSDLKPVLFWLHGGSFTMGGTTSYNVDGMLQYRRDAVVVTANYRLGALGFLGGKAVAESTVDGSSGNFGLQDSRLALKWVQRNIHSFGGDPQRVTIFGESAGASLVETHLAAARSNGLFRNAIMQSGAFDNYTVQKDPESTFALFADKAGCDHTSSDVMQCLRSVPIYASDISGQSLIQALGDTSTQSSFGPTIDFVELLETPELSARKQRLNNVSSAIIGTNLHEGNFLMPLMMPMNNGPQATQADLTSWLQTFYPDSVEAIAKLYSAELGVLTPWETAAQIYTDSQYLCPTQRSARWLSNNGATAYVYRLEYKPAFFDIHARLVFQQSWCSDFSVCKNISLVDPGVGHSADVYMLFQDPRMNSSESIVAQSILDYWENFATSGNPSRGAAKVSSWPTFLPNNVTMSLRAEPILQKNLRLKYCEFWENTPSGQQSSRRQHEFTRILI